ncbi:MAG: hypothetical protein RLZZ196_3753 [Bacteroidota bacterium]|jgi:hypothetical protein
MITKQSHPKSFELFKSYVKTRAGQISSKEIPAELMDNIVNDNMISLSLSNFSRDLYDFFDAQGIIISVWNPGQGWKYRIADNFPVESSSAGRKEAEKLAFTEAFNRLEKR